jgi:MFS family permease
MDMTEQSAPPPPPPDNNNKSKLSSSIKIPTSAWITLAILGSSLLITMYGETMLLPAIPDIIRDFNISYNTSSWILTAYLIAGAVMTPIAGKLSDIYGRKKMVLIIMIIYIIGISIGGFSTNIYLLLVARVIQGIGISMFPIAFGIIRDKFPKEKLAVGIGIFSSMFAAGSVIGLAIGGSIIKNIGWHATFFTIIPIAIGLWLIIRRLIHDSSDRISQLSELETNRSKYCISCGKVIVASRFIPIDIKGAITLSVAIISFLLVLTYLGENSNIRSIEFIGFLIAGIASLVLFVYVEKRNESPLIDLNILVDKIILPANIIIMIFGITMFMVYQTIPVLVRSPQPLGFGGDAIATANVQLPFMIIFLVLAPSSGFIIAKLGNLKPTLVGSIISTIGFFSLFLFHSTELLVAVNLAIIATGLSLMQVGGFNIAIEATPRKFSGISLGMTVVLNLIGSSIGPAIAAIYMQANQEKVKGLIGSFPSSAAYNGIFLTAAIISIVSIVLVIIIKRRMMSLNHTTIGQS